MLMNDLYLHFPVVFILCESVCVSGSAVHCPVGYKTLGAFHCGMMAMTGSADVFEMAFDIRWSILMSFPTK